MGALCPRILFEGITVLFEHRVVRNKNMHTQFASLELIDRQDRESSDLFPTVLESNAISLSCAKSCKTNAVSDFTMNKDHQGVTLP